MIGLLFSISEVVIFFFSSFHYVLSLIPQQKKQPTKAESQDRLLQELASAKQQIAKLQQVAKDSEKYKRRITELEQSLAASNQVKAKLESQLNTAAKQKGVFLSHPLPCLHVCVFFLTAL